VLTLLSSIKKAKEEQQHGAERMKKNENRQYYWRRKKMKITLSRQPARTKRYTDRTKKLKE
jgi:hypothetical protein